MVEDYNAFSSTVKLLVLLVAIYHKNQWYIIIKLSWVNQKLRSYINMPDIKVSICLKDYEG